LAHPVVILTQLRQSETAAMSSPLDREPDTSFTCLLTYLLI